MSSLEQFKYNWIDGVERLELYRPGGYHPIMINDIVHGRYQIVDKLGFGGYSTIWLAWDKRSTRYVAIKVGVAHPPTTRREAGIIQALSSSTSVSKTSTRADFERHNTVPVILDQFEIDGPNGTHTCYSVAPAQGNLRDASFSRLFPIKVARVLVAKLARAVSLVHSQGFTHGDIHLRNLLIKLPSDLGKLPIDQFRGKYGEPETVQVSRVDGMPLTPSVPSLAVLSLHLGKKAQDFTLDDARGLVLSDFGEAFNPDQELRLGKDCHTPLAKRAPEALFEPEAPLSYSADIWSLGITMWEILGMKALFSDGESAAEIVAQQLDVLGSNDFPHSWRKQWERSSANETSLYDDVPLRPTYDREMWPPLREAFEEFVQKYRRKREMTGVFGRDETRSILDLIKGMLNFRPEERLTIAEVLGSEWMVEWALPELKQYA